jgi:hypothetical protein
VTGPAAAVRDDRRHFLRSRRRVLVAASVTVAALAAFAVLLLAPNRLASLRLGGVALAWWAAGAAAAAGLLAVSRGYRGTGAVGANVATSRFTPFALAVVWGSPAVWLGFPPLLLADGTRGLWPPAVVIGGTTIALLVLGARARCTGGLVATASMLTRARWPGARGCQALLGSAEAVVAVLFVWAQFAAAREIGAMAGWPRTTTIGVTLVVLGAVLLPDASRLRLAALGGGLALVGLAMPLAAVALRTTTAWPWAWSVVASRPRIAFGEDSSWTLEGGALRGAAATPTMRFAEEQRVVFGGRGSIIVEPREGGRSARDVEAGEEVVLYPGDGLVVPGGLRLRFEPGRRIPGAPDSGPEWMEPAPRKAGWPGLIALGVTGLLGILGLPAGADPPGAGRLPPWRGAQLAAVLVASGVALAVAWGLYAAWLTPEVYVGGVGGAEVYALPASVPALGASGGVLAWVALIGLAAGGAGAALGGLRGLPGAQDQATAVGRRARRLAILLAAGAGLLACLVPAGPWALLVAALGLAASALAPTVVLACWSERATPRGIAAGATVGFTAFVLVLLAGVGSLAGPAEGWGSAVLAAPAALAASAHLLVAWLLRSRRTPSSRRPLPPGFAGLSTPLPMPPRGG